MKQQKQVHRIDDAAESVEEQLGRRQFEHNEQERECHKDERNN